ncbi:hypothetical protein Avbf_13011, partial [Armadillidium vulgare]
WHCVPNIHNAIVGFGSEQVSIFFKDLFMRDQRFSLTDYIWDFNEDKKDMVHQHLKANRMELSNIKLRTEIEGHSTDMSKQLNETECSLSTRIIDMEIL